MRMLKVWLPVGIAALALFVMFTYESKEPICPDDFKTFEESSAAFDAWLVVYLETHDSASMTDVSMARKQFYIDHHCTEALERFEDGER